jgi:hypothetical protein
LGRNRRSSATHCGRAAHHDDALTAVQLSDLFDGGQQTGGLGGLAQAHLVRDQAFAAHVEPGDADSLVGAEHDAALAARAGELPQPLVEGGVFVAGLGVEFGQLGQGEVAHGADLVGGCVPHLVGQ